MSRTALVTGFTIVLVVLAAVPTAYGLRWSYCRHYGDQLWAIHSHPRIDHEKFSWSKKSKEDRDKLQRWSDAIAKHYAPEHDSWNALTEIERDYEKSRKFSEHIEKWVFVLTPDVKIPVPNCRIHQISYFFGTPSIDSAAVSENGQLVAHYSWQSPDDIRIGFYLLDESGERFHGSHFLSNDESSWFDEYVFHETNYLLSVELPEKRFARYYSRENADVFVEDGLISIDELEAAISDYIDSDEPALRSRKLIPVVDVKACTCDKEYVPANRHLTIEEKARVLADVKLELDRRRSLLREHGKVVYETLQKIRIDLE